MSVLYGAGSTVYKLHPVVVFSILDHFKRREEGQSLVVGTLLGEKKGNFVYIKNSFPVPSNIVNDDLAQVDKVYHDQMLKLHKQVNETEVVVGWYSTGGKTTYISSQIHQEMFQAEFDIDQPVHLRVEVEVEMKSPKLSVKAFTVKTVKVGDKDVLARFELAPLEYHAYEAEKIGVDSLITGTPEDSRLDAPASILSDFESIDLSLSKLLESLHTISEYVKKVVDKKEKGDASIGQAIHDAITAIPKMDVSKFKKSMNGTIQDLLMVVYLSNLTRTQVALADKITGLL